MKKKEEKNFYIKNKDLFFFIIIAIFFIEIAFSYIYYINILKRPILVNSFNREAINPKIFSIFKDSIFLIDINGKLIRQINKSNGNILWEFEKENIIDIIMTSDNRIYLLLDNPMRFEIFYNKKLINTILINENIEPSNMVIDAYDNIYILDKKTKEILKNDLEGKILERIKINYKRKEISIGTMTISSNILYIVIKPGIVIAYDLNKKKFIYEKLIPYITNGEKAYNSIFVKNINNGDIYVNDHIGSRMLVFNKNWKLKGMFYQDSQKRFRMIACGPFDIDEKYIYINNYLIFVYPLIN